MKAIIFAAGLGTRLGQITQHTPKAMVMLKGKPLIYHAINKLKESGITEIIVNVHHYSDQIIDYIHQNNFGIPIHISNESDQLLDTGGGLVKARQFLDGTEPFMAYNVDIITSLNLYDLMHYHKQHKALATLVVRQRNTSRYFLFDEQMQLAGWTNTATGEVKLSSRGLQPLKQWAFSGIQIISPQVFDLIEETGKFSITPLYLKLAQTHAIIGFPDKSDFWLDLGKPEQFEQAEKILSNRK